MATRSQWRNWYAQFGGWLPYERVRFGVLGVIAGGLVLLVPDSTPLTVFLGCGLVVLGLATVARGVAGIRTARRETRRGQAARWRPHG